MVPPSAPFLFYSISLSPLSSAANDPEYDNHKDQWYKNRRKKTEYTHQR